MFPRSLQEPILLDARSCTAAKGFLSEYTWQSALVLFDALNFARYADWIRSRDRQECAVIKHKTSDVMQQRFC